MNEKKLRASNVVNYLIYKGIANSQKEVGELLGYGESYFSQIISGTKPLSDSVLKKLASLDDGKEINLMWLLTGEGSMLKSADEDTTTEELMPGNAVTFHPGLTAQAGYVDMPGEEDDSTELFFIKGYEGCHAIRATGDSMYPTITNGDIVIHEMNTERYIRNGEVYIVVDELGALMVKRVTQDVSPEDEIMFTFFSDNPNQAKYKPFSIPGEQIKRLYRVRAVIKQLT